MAQTSTLSVNPPSPSGGRRGGRNGGRGGRSNRGRGRNGGCYQHNNYNKKLPPLLPTTVAIDTTTPCQICNRFGHTARVCYERGNFAYTATSGRDSNPPTDRASWCVDSGASQHMTPHLQHIQTPSPYTGNNTITVGNGCSLPISHSGSTTLPNSLQIKNILHVPCLTKNLLSIQNFSRDNNYYFILDDHGFCVKDKKTGQTLLNGPSLHGFYRAFLPPSSVPACLSAQTTPSLWHLRLGHPSPTALWQTLCCTNIKHSSVQHVYPTCPLGKSTNKPFDRRQHTASSPLELLHLDLWRPVPTVSEGYLYYLSIVDDYS